MCSLLVLRGLHRDHPLLVAANRDERRDRKASPPGIWHGERRKVLSPRDRVAGGTWIAVNDRCHFAALTNLKGVPPVVDAPSRGHLPHLALDHDELDEGVDAVLRRLREHAHSGFHLVVADAARMVVIRHAGGDVRVVEWGEPVLALTNEHEPGAVTVRGLAAALQPDLGVDARLDALARPLLDVGDERHHAMLKRGEHYGTVSSSLIAVPRRDPEQLVWRFAAGAPDATGYRNYGNLGRRLLPGGP